MRAMKDSGIEWLGEVPAGWEMIRIGAHFWEVKDKNKDASINALKFNAGTIVRKDLPVVNDADLQTLSGYTCVLPGDEVINCLNLNFDLKSQRVGLVEEAGIITSAYLVVRHDAMYDSRFCNYSLKAFDYRKAFHNMGTGIRKTLNWAELRQYRIPTPLLDEQRRIANFLDEKCIQIDRAIAVAEQSIQEYKTYKNSVVFQAVTKGLDSDASMKDSGVEWLGEVPSEWDVVPLKRVATLHHGSDPKLEGEVPVYGSGQSSFKTCGEYKEGPTVLLGRKGTLDCPQYIEGKFWNVDTAFDVAIRSENMTIKFLYYAICSFDPGVLSTNTVKPSMTQGAWYSVRLPLPPLIKQRRIVDFLDERCVQIESAVETKQAIIDELKSYKKSLIYEIVTGKREV